MISKNIILPSMKIDFVSANSVGPDEMPRHAAFHLGPHLGPHYMFAKVPVLGVSGFQRVKDCL